MKLRAVQIACRRFGGDFLRGRTALGGGDIAEDQLGQLVGLSVLPNPLDIADTQVDLAARIVGQIGIDDALVQPQLTTISLIDRQLPHGMCQMLRVLLSFLLA